MNDELAKVEDDLRYLSKLEEQGHNCGFYVELLYEYRDRLLAKEATMDEQVCDDCKYNLYSVHKEPCCSCVVLDDKLSNFVPAEVMSDVDND